jgi:predicted O-linked N-acetylglucosamine transferase (SPINDLY family)
MNAITQPADRQLRQAHRHHERGMALLRQQQWSEALKAYEAALTLSPHEPIYLLHAAKAALEGGLPDRALTHSECLLQASPDSDEACFVRVKALQRLQRHSDILGILERLPDGRRNSCEYWNALGMAQQKLGRHQEAISSFMQALSYKIDDAMSHYLMGISFYEIKLKEEASECFRTGLMLGLGQNALHVHGMLAYAESENCRWQQAAEELDKMRDIVDRLPSSARVMSLPFAHVALTSDPVHQLKACRLMSNSFGNIRPTQSSVPAHRGERLRLGYVSSDFYQHATAVLMAEVLEHHDRSRFEVFLYSHGPDDKTPMRKRLEEACEHFIELEGLPDQDIAQRIADDQIDLLVDLKGYTAHNRLGVFMRRPARVQATFLGFPGTTGGAFMDYIIGDPVVTPLEHAAHFSERIAQMPVCYQPNDRQRPMPSPMTRAEVGLPEDKLVLCGFNQAYKISAQVLDQWVVLLREMPDAVLWLLDWHGQARPNLARELLARGVSHERVHWAPKLGLAEHISRLPLADIFLDTWPYNAHTTCSDALWAGVPVVTLQGQTFASRVASSLLMACGLHDWVATTVDGYRQKVLLLARNSALRQQVREHLNAERGSSPLFNSERFTRDFEALVERMVQRDRAGKSASALPAATS